jgi:excisionase family DNA binding protein
MSTNLLTTEEVAKMLGLQEHTLRDWRRAKRHPLPYVKVGRSVRFRLSDVEAFISAHLVEV